MKIKFKTVFKSLQHGWNCLFCFCYCVSTPLGFYLLINNKFSEKTRDTNYLEIIYL